MKVTMFKGKLHRLTVTEADLYYEGSITLDVELMERAKMLAYERVQVVNVNNGARLETLYDSRREGEPDGVPEWTRGAPVRPRRRDYRDRVRRYDA